MKLLPSFLVSRHLLLLLVVMIMSRTASAARKARLVRVVGEDREATASVATSSPSTTPSPWMFANIENTTHDGIIAMGFVRRRYLNIGDRLTVDMDGAQMDAEIVGLPFYNNG